MKTSLLYIPLLFVHTSVYTQPEVDDPSQFEITNNVVEEQPYALPDAERARISDNSDLFDGRSASFYRDASNINTGTLSNARLNSDLGERTIANARKADSADFAQNAAVAATAARASVADFSENAGRLEGNSASFYRNASNINAGVLNNVRLNSDLGDRTIGNARNADFAEETDTSNLTGGGGVQIGQRGVFSRQSYDGQQLRRYDIPEGASTVMIEAICRTLNNAKNSDARMKARVSIYFNAGFTDQLSLCYSGRNSGDKDHQTSANTVQFDIPNGASQLFVQLELWAQDAPALTGGNIYWFGASGEAQSGLNTGVSIRASGSTVTERSCHDSKFWERAAHCYLDGVQVNTTASTSSTSTGGSTGGSTGSSGGSSSRDTFGETAALN